MTNDSWKGGLLVLALLAGLGVVCPLLAAPYVPLVDPDEGKHAAIAQEMVESGDWIVPRLLHEPFLDKPILYFWAVAASLKLFGMSETAVRLPGLLFGMLGTLTTAAIAWRMLGRRTALVAGIFYASMILPLVLAQLPTHDVALVSWVNLALLCLWESDRPVRSAGFSRKHALPPEGGTTNMTAWHWTVAAGLLLGLAVLTKGLAGVALVGIAYGGYLVVSGQLRFVHGLRAALALGVAAIVGSSWYLAMDAAHPGFLHYYFVTRHLLGFFTGTQPHGQEPWWYYFPMLAIGGMPWIAYLPVLARDAIDRRRTRTAAANDGHGMPFAGETDRSRKRKRGWKPVSLLALRASMCGTRRVPHTIDRPLLPLVCWLAGCTLFLTVSRSKLGTYIWPVLPAIAILTAVVWVRKIEGLLSETAERWMGRTVWCSCLVAPLTLPTTFIVAQIVLPVRFSLFTWTLVFVAAATSLAPLWSWLRGRRSLTLGLAAASVFGQLAVLLACAFPQAAAAFSGRDLAAYFNRTRELPSRLMMVQERLGSVIFYLDPDLRRRLHGGQMVDLDIDNVLPSPIPGGKEYIAIPERHLRVALADYDLESLPYQPPAASGSIAAATWSRGHGSIGPIVRWWPRSRGTGWAQCQSQLLCADLRHDGAGEHSLHRHAGGPPRGRQCHGSQQFPFGESHGRQGPALPAPRFHEHLADQVWRLCRDHLQVQPHFLFSDFADTSLRQVMGQRVNQRLRRAGEFTQPQQGLDDRRVVVGGQ